MPEKNLEIAAKSCSACRESDFLPTCRKSKWPPNFDREKFRSGPAKEMVTNTVSLSSQSVLEYKKILFCCFNCILPISPTLDLEISALTATRAFGPRAVIVCMISRSCAGKIGKMQESSPENYYFVLKNHMHNQNILRRAQVFVGNPP